MKKYFKSLGYTFSLMIILSLIVTILNYVGLANGLFFNILKLIIPIVSIFVGGLIIGINSKEKGWLNGLKIGIIVIALFALTIFGSMIGISKNSEN